MRTLLTPPSSEKRKKSGVGANFCIHKYFFERSEIWKTVQAEEQQAAQALTKTEDVDLDEEDEPMTPAPHLGMIQFEPIDTRHLSSLPLIRARLEKLLKNSPSHMHRAQNLLVTIVEISLFYSLTSNPDIISFRAFQTQRNQTVASFRHGSRNLWYKASSRKSKFVPRAPKGNSSLVSVCSH